MIRHDETFLQLKELGSRYPGYQPTFDFAGEYINEAHGLLAGTHAKNGVHLQIKPAKFWSSSLSMTAHDILIGIRNIFRFGWAIPGWLRREDALKLYEMAYFSPGDILELGSYHGLSTCILAQANLDRPDPKAIYTLDIDPSCNIATLQTLRNMNNFKGVNVICNDAASAVHKFASDNKRFGCIFIDHSHRYVDVVAVCKELKNVLVEGGFCLFHDFNDPKNCDPADDDYGVYQAVQEGLDHTSFQFYGVFGCMGVYRVA
jgi:predicted O-methyltransferase YrrM